MIGWKVLFVVMMSIGMTVGEASPLPGPFFSSPNNVVQMDKSWKEMPITAVDHPNADIVISLDQALYEGLQSLIQEYARNNHLDIAISKGTCGITAGGLIKKQIDIGGLCCPPGANDRLPGVQFHTLGIAPISILMNPNNHITSLTLEQLREIFSGHIYKWERLPSSGMRGNIHVTTRLHCKLRPGHWRQLLDNENDFSPSARDVGAIRDLLEIVATDPKAIGYESPWMVNRYGYNSKVKRIDVSNGANPNGGHALFRTFNVTTWSDNATRNPEAEKLVAWLIKESQRIDSHFQFISAATLRNHGWIFQGDELVGLPDISHPDQESKR